jgi:4-hydroxy-tetrahydrodipicolinate synthase
MRRMTMAGVLAPVLTPFDQELAPDTARWVRHCKWLLDHGCSGLAIFGTTSEANSLSVEERQAMLEALLDAGVPASALMPGTGCCALPDTVRLTRRAARAGCAGVLMLPPFYYKGVSDEGLFRSYAAAIDGVGDERLRVFLYHIPQVSQVGIPLRVIERLLKAYPGTVAGIKDSSGDWANTKAVLEAFPGFEVFVGTEKHLLANLRAGGAGCITASANVNALAIDRLYREWKSPGAQRLQDALDAVRGILEKQPMIPALKEVLAETRGEPQWRAVRPPLVELGLEERAALHAALRGSALQL